MVDSQDWLSESHRLRKIGWTGWFWIFGSINPRFNPRFLRGLIQQGTATERTALRYELCAKMRKASLPSGERWGLVEVKKTYGVSTCIYSIDTWTILFSQDPNRSYLALNITQQKNTKLLEISRVKERRRGDVKADIGWHSLTLHQEPLAACRLLVTSMIGTSILFAWAIVQQTLNLVIVAIIAILAMFIFVFFFAMVSLWCSLLPMPPLS